MRTTIKVMMTACITLLSLVSASAKPIPNLSQAFDDMVQALVDKGFVTASQTNTYSRGHRHSYTFKIPEAEAKLVTEYEHKMMANIPLAYSSTIRRAGTDGNSVSIAYGEQNKGSYSTCNYKDRNYTVLMLRDFRDSTMRYAYVLSWYVKNKYTEGTISRFYGMDPVWQRNNSVSRSARVVSWHNGTPMQYYGDTIVMKRGSRPLSSANALSELDSLSLDDIGVKFMNGVEPKTSGDVVMLITRLASAYASIANGASANVAPRRMLAYQILNMTFRYTRVIRLLTQDDKKLCAEQIKSLNTQDDDEHTRAVLNNAISLLK